MDAVLRGDDQPLASCIMPTFNRRPFIPLALSYFQRQEYPRKELIIVDDGDDCIADLIPADEAIKYIRLKTRITLGEKLNIACSNASGSIIVNWDDDDWYAPRRLNYQLSELRKQNSKVCGINHLLYFDIKKKQAYQYRYPASEPKWLLGSSLCYSRSLWEENHFEPINVGMDGLFVWRTSPGAVAVLPDSTMSVHMIHDQNISPKRTTANWWHPYPVEEIEHIMQADLDYYYQDRPLLRRREKAKITRTTVNPEPKKEIKNIYACLVHERLDCVIDLVRNLHFNDPSSIILLFSGDSDFRLESSLFPFEEFGTITRQLRHKVEHGYLHHFALECMEFALSNFSFDILTIVDSDQLSLKPNYSGFMSEFFLNNSNVGLLSNRPERITVSDTDVWTCIQPFREYDLWKPFLKNFAGGEEKFVHWSFWPSTVFTYDATKDLVKIFKTDKQLQHIMEHTKIWATEEVVLPTLVGLLGYSILLNPCCHTYVNYQKNYSGADLQSAINTPQAYWIHPVARRYDDIIRKETRWALNSYVGNQNTQGSSQSDQALFFPLETIRRINNIEGWLSDAEADLLIACLLKACLNHPDGQVVEVGSYRGRASVLMGTLARSVSDKIKVYAVDKHDGILGSADQGLYAYKPSLDDFNANISRHSLSETVIPIVGRSAEVSWEKPLSFLLIDGLHDYLNINDDFQRFAPFIEINGFVAFHDYADYFPDVRAFVDDLIVKRNYQKVDVQDSLIVLQKLPGRPALSDRQ